MLGSRLLVSAVLIPLVIGIFYLDHKSGEQALYLLGLTLILAARCAWEMKHLLHQRFPAFNVGWATGCTLLCVAASWLPVLIPSGKFRWQDDLGSLGGISLAFAVSVIALFTWHAFRYRQPGNTMETLGAELLTVGYVGVLLGVTSQLRWVAGAEAGYLVLGSVVVGTKCGDIGAYTLGRMFGKRKMIPALSPGKTWMGGLGALIGAGLTTWIWLRVATPLFNPDWTPPAWFWALLYGVLLGIVGLIGDLCESLIKRDVSQKDSAALMPGFGGLLDLLDSIIYAGPIAWILWQILPLSTWQ